mgnify:CR=1 FL=1
MRRSGRHAAAARARGLTRTIVERLARRLAPEDYHALTNEGAPEAIARTRCACLCDVGCLRSRLERSAADARRATALAAFAGRFARRSRLVPGGGHDGEDIRGELANGVGTSNPGTPTSASGPPEGGRGGTGGETDGDLARRVRDLEGDVERLVDADGGAGVARRVAVLEDNHKTLERRTRRVERVVEDVRSAEDRRARADEAERMRELRLGAGRGLGGGSTSGGGPRRRRGSSSSSSSSEDGREWSSSGRGDDPIAALAGASVSTGLHGGFG